MKKQAADLKLARAEAEAANRAKSAFLANIGHELRTPLNAILGFSSLLRDEVAHSRQRRDLETIHRCAEQLQAWTDDLLDYAKAGTAQEAVKNSPCSIEALADDLSEMFRGAARDKNLSFEVQTVSYLPDSVQVDAGKLRKVLVHLIANAIQFTESGSVTVRVATQSLRHSGTILLTFEVEDTGAGISEPDRERIFGAFVQAGPESSQRGTGLGLTIARRLVDMMGGAISVMSELGQGSTFRVEVPAETATRTPARSTSGDRGRVIGLEAGQREYRVLVADDNYESRDILERILHRAGFSVRTVRDGAAAVEAFRTWRPDFIWMDPRIPVMSGSEAARIIRELDGGREVRIAAITTSTLPFQRMEMLSQGIDDFVRKPYRFDEIFDCLARQLGVRYRRDLPRGNDPLDPATLNPLDLAEIPPRLRADLAAAVAALDSRRVEQTIANIALIHPDLADTLKQMANRYAYSAIRNALEAARSHGTSGG